MDNMPAASTELENLRGEVARLRAEVAEFRGSGRAERESGARRISRGGLLRSAGVALTGAAGVAVLGSSPTPADAANGSAVIAGQDNTATAVTSISGSVLSDAGLRVSNYYSGPFDDYSDGVQAYTYGAGLSALYGRNDAAGGAGVMGYSGSGVGGSFSGGLAPLRLQPAATAGAPTSFNHQQGEFYVDSAGALWLCTQSGTATTVGTFQQVSLSTSGAALVKIGESLLTASAANVTFTNIPQSYRHLTLRIQGRSDAASTYVMAVMQFNSDSSGSYDLQSLQAYGTYTAGTQAFGTTSAQLGYMSASTATAGTASTFAVDIVNYAGTTFRKQWLSTQLLKVAESANQVNTDVFAGEWRNSAAITSLTIFPSTGNFVTGTLVSLHGVL
jgi:hypothetical protein